MKVITASTGRRTVKISKLEWETIGAKAGWLKVAIEEIDENTRIVGKVGSLKDAMALCRQKYRRLPRPGYEILIDSGDVKIKGSQPGTVWEGEQSYAYKTYLTNHADQYRVWTWISSSPGIQASSKGSLEKEAKWSGDVEIEQTGEHAGKSIAELQKQKSSLKKRQEAHKKSHDGKADSEISKKLKEVNFAIRAKRGWKGGAK